MSQVTQPTECLDMTQNSRLFPSTSLPRTGSRPKWGWSSNLIRGRRNRKGRLGVGESVRNKQRLKYNALAKFKHVREFRMIHNACRLMQMTMQMRQRGGEGYSSPLNHSRSGQGKDSLSGSSFPSKPHLQNDFLRQPAKAPGPWGPGAASWTDVAHTRPRRYLHTRPGLWNAQHPHPPAPVCLL